MKYKKQHEIAKNYDTIELYYKIFKKMSSKKSGEK
jgi:hypothetical protein